MSSSSPNSSLAPPHVLELSDDTLISNCLQLKREGNRLFQARRYDEALHKYEQGLQFSEVMFRTNPSTELRFGIPFQKDFHLLLSVCDYKMRLYPNCRRHCTAVMTKLGDTDNVRALFRRGMALGKMKRFGEAAADFERVLELDPTHSGAATMLRSMTLRVKESEKSEKSESRLSSRSSSSAAPSVSGESASDSEAVSEVEGVRQSHSEMGEREEQEVETETETETTTETETGESSRVYTAVASAFAGLAVGALAAFVVWRWKKSDD